MMIFAGNNSTFLVDDIKKEVFACGQNSYGQLGIGDANAFVFTEVKALKNMDILSIDAGPDYSLFLMKNGSVFACGMNNDGKLGIKATKNRTIIKTPREILGLKNLGVKAVAGNSLQTFFLLEDKSVWTYGLGDTPQNTTLEKIKPNLKNVEAIAATNWNFIVLYKLNEIGAVLEFKNGNSRGKICSKSNMKSFFIRKANNIESITSLGFCCALLLTKNQKVIVWEQNRIQSPSFREIPNLKVSKVANGFYFSLLMTTDHKCVKLDSRDCIIPGVGKKILKPKIIELPGKFKDIAAGSYHSAFLMENGDLFTRIELMENGDLFERGENDHGQLGNPFYRGPDPELIFKGSENKFLYT